MLQDGNVTFADIIKVHTTQQTFFGENPEVLHDMSNFMCEETMRLENHPIQFDPLQLSVSTIDDGGLFRALLKHGWQFFLVSRVARKRMTSAFVKG